MKRIEWAIAAILLSSTFFGPALAGVQAGITAAVRGEVNLDPVTGELAHAAQSGEDVFLGDGISSGDHSGLQLMLLDETIFTVGPNTELTVDDFVYDPATGAGRMTASLTKGVFRFVTGKIAKGDPDDMIITLPTGTIGIRGTTGVVGTLDNGLSGAITDLLVDAGIDAGLPEGPVILALLLETEQNAEADKKGMVVSNEGESVELTVPGWASLLAPGQPPTPPFFAPDVLDMGGFLANLTPSGPPVGGPQASFDDSNDVGGAFDLGGLEGPIGDLGPVDLGPPPAPDEAIRTDLFCGTCGGVGGGGLATFEEIRGITGTGSYNIAEALFTQTTKLGNSVNILGHFHASGTVNFATQQFFLSIQVDTIEDGNGGNLSFSVNNTSFSDDYIGETGPATGSFDLIDSDFKDTSGSLINSDGIIANLLSLNVVFDDGSNAGNGSGVSTPRQ